MSDDTSTGGLMALIRLAMNSPSGAIQLAFAEPDGLLFQMPDDAIAKVSKHQVAFNWNAGIDEVLRVLRFVDPANEGGFRAGDDPTFLTRESSREGA